jgi:hypothetical protein
MAGSISTTPLSTTGNISSSSTVRASSWNDECELIKKPTTYTYTASRVGDDSATEAMFSTLSMDMVTEFRYSIRRHCNKIMMSVVFSVMKGDLELYLLVIFPKVETYVPDGEKYL